MTVSLPPQKNKRYRNMREYLFIFQDIESLTQGIIFLYRLKYNFKSALYKTEKDYRLLIKSNGMPPYLFCLNEFCQRRSCNTLEIAYTKEYGIPLISSNAVKVYGKYFI